MIIILFITIFSKGYSAFYQTRIKLDINFNEELIDPTGAREITTLNTADYSKLISQSLFKFLNVDKSNPKASEIKSLISYNSFLTVRDHVLKNPDIIGKTKKGKVEILIPLPLYVHQFWLHIYLAGQSFIISIKI